MRRRAMLALVMIGVASVIAGGVALAAAGDLDRTFGENGVATADFGTDGNKGQAMVVRPDGRIVVVGQTGNGGFALASFNPDGSIDETFGGDGTVTTGFSGPDGDGFGNAYALVLQPDGRLVAAGERGYPGSSDFALARYNPDGALDKTFGGDGTVTTNFPTGDRDDVAYSLVLQPDGRLVAAGESYPDLALARYNTDGTLDGTFGGDGRVLTDADGGPRDYSGSIEDLALQRDGKLVAAGHGGAGAERFAVVRYKAGGALDKTFADGGRKFTRVESLERYSYASSVVLIKGGGIVAAGYSREYSNNSQPAEEKFALVGYRPNGDLDPGFGNNGKVVTPMTLATPSGQYGGRVEDLAFLPGGARDKILAVGSTGFRGGGPTALVRYFSGGNRDKSFGGDGRVFAQPENGSATAVVPQSDGKLLVAGKAYQCEETQDPESPDCSVRIAAFRYEGN